MKHIILALLALFISSQANAWVVSAEFEKGTLGELAIGVDALSGTLTDNTTFSDEFVHNGNFSAKMTVIQGDTKWGGYNMHPELLKEGDEIWMRYYLYFPTGFDFTCSQCIGIKTMRIHTRSAGGGDGTNEGYIDVLIDDEDGLNIFNEVAGQAFADYWFAKTGKTVPSVGTIITTGQWYAIEQYVKFSSTPGKGIYRVWQDGILVFEDKANITMASGTSESDLNFIFGFWNGDAPKTQSAYFDDFVIASSTPSNLDASGNPFIGLNTTTFIAAPKPPVITSVVVNQ